MYTRIEDFINSYSHEAQTTQRVLAALTPAALGVEKDPAEQDPKLAWNAGKIAWHIAVSPYEIVNEFGGGIEIFPQPDPLSVDAIVAEYARVQAAVVDLVKGKYSDSDLPGDVTAFGWPMPLGSWLMALVHHEIHHRGQLSVLMRQAGLTVPNIYGPNKEETAKYFAEAAAAPQS